jgi:hypothetical protein
MEKSGKCQQKRDFAGDMVKGRRRAVEGGTNTNPVTRVSLYALMLLNDASKRAGERIGMCGLVLSPPRPCEAGYVMRRKGGEGNGGC